MKQTVRFSLAIAVIFTAFITSCNTKKSNTTMETKTGIAKAAWGNTDGKEVFLYTLTNAKGVQVKITNYGGTVTSWVSTDKNN